MRVAAGAQRTDQMFDIGGGAHGGGFGVLRGEIGVVVPEFRQDVARLCRENHDLGVESIKVALRIEQFLAVRIESPDVHRQIDAVEERECAKNRNHRLDGKRTQDCQPTRNQRQVFAHRGGLLQRKLRVGDGRRLGKQLAHQTERARILASFDRTDKFLAVGHWSFKASSGGRRIARSLRLNLTNDPRWRTNNYRSWRDVCQHHRAGPDYCAGSDSNPGTYNRTRPYPGIRTEPYRSE